ncbi:MAG TPA: B12-binding domain-containing radical SAM protein [Clostridia bacterium]|nr:B12-binding domain-containing radical SAM protein [Clostridia bacterium]
MKILLTTLNSKFIHSSLAIRYLRAVIEPMKNIDVELKEYTINMHTEDILVDLYKGQYDLIIFSTYIWNYSEITNLTRALKKVCPETKILLGGPEVSYASEEEMKDNPNIDFIIYGEGEDTFKEFIKAFKVNQSYESINGLVYREKRNIIKNSERPLIKDLDEIPFPYKDTLEGLDHRIIYYESTRGCPFNCSYCLSSTIKGVRYFSLDRVKEDMLFFLKKNVKQVKFVDRTFNVKKEHYFEIIKFLNNNDNGVTNFHFEITASLLDQEVIDYLKTVRPGLFQLEVGVQTTNTNSLETINRGMDFLSIKKTLVEIVRLENIHSHLDLIAGLPYEDFDSFLSSFNDVYSLNPNKLQLGFLKILKGSEMEKNHELYGLVYDDSPPYQIYFNKFINFDEMIVLKGIEELLDIYYNSNYFAHALDYLVNKKFKSPSSFYHAFYEYWCEKKLFEHKHSKLKRYKILLDFYNETFDSSQVFDALLKFDYILNKNKKIDKLFYRIKPNGYRNSCHEFLQDEEKIEKYLPHFKDKNAKYIIKRVHFEKFKFDIKKFINSNYELLEEKETTILFDYSKSTLNERSLNFEVSLEKGD